MHIHVLLFASLRERLGQSQSAVELALIHDTSVGALWQLLSGMGQRLPERVLCAVNQEYMDQEVMLRDGDEVAFFSVFSTGDGWLN